MGRNIIICFDGTSNEFGKVDTNVLRIMKVIDQKQPAYYDPGVGTFPEPGYVTSIGKRLSDLAGLAFGAGLMWKVGEAYSYLMETWEPGDLVFIFGFSRGAYSARVLAGLLHAFGLLSQGNQNLVPYMMRMFKGLRDERKKNDNKVGRWRKLCDEFRKTFARDVVLGDRERRFPTHFLGVWDTVSSVGSVWNPDRYPYTANNPSIAHIRHAVSIDERRAFFWQNLFARVSGQDLIELWFAGSHCDVGGGYPETEGTGANVTYCGTWRNAFTWMLDEAVAQGMVVDPIKRTEVLDRIPPCVDPPTEKIHDSLVLKWWAAEIVPKWKWNSETRESLLRCGLGRRRKIKPGSLIHHSALRRICETNYCPSNLSKTFCEKIRKLPKFTDSLPY